MEGALMDKTNGELLELLSYYDDLTAKQAECIAQMSRMITRQAWTIAMLKDDRMSSESAEQIKADMQKIKEIITEAFGELVEP
jgi:hypothetical protein